MAWPRAVLLRLADTHSEPHESSATPNRCSIVELFLGEGMSAIRTVSSLRIAAVFLQQTGSELGTGLRREMHHTGNYVTILFTTQKDMSEV